MFEDTTTTKSTSPYIKIPSVPGLYRHSKSGRYYAAKKINGKRRERSLRTADRQIAQRRQRDWETNLRVIDREVERTNFEQLMDSFLAANRGKSGQTSSVTIALCSLEMRAGAAKLSPADSGV